MAAKAPRSQRQPVPPFGLATINEKYVPALTFTPGDVRELIEAARLTPIQGLNRRVIARQLEEAVLDLVIKSPIGSAPGQRRDWLGKVRDAALNLMAIWNVDPKTGRQRQVDATAMLLSSGSKTDRATDLIREAMGPYLKVASTTVEPRFESASLTEAGPRSCINEMKRPPPVRLPFMPTAFLPPFTALCLAWLAKTAEIEAKALDKERQAKSSRLGAQTQFIAELCRISQTISGKKATLTTGGPAITFCCAVATRTLGWLPKASPHDTTPILSGALTDLANNRSIVRERIRDSWNGGPRRR